MYKTHFFTRTLSHSLLLLIAALLAACNTSKPMQQLDFGAPIMEVKDVTPGPTRTLNIVLAHIEVPANLDGNAMLYRLAYDNAQALQAYANSNWSVPPAQLLAQQLKHMGASRGVNIVNQQDGVKNLPQLRLELIEFSQIFSSAEQSQATVIFRASLVKQHHLIAQRLFNGKAAAGANAQSGARAMHIASQDALQQLIAWINASDFSDR